MRWERNGCGRHTIVRDQEPSAAVARTDNKQGDLVSVPISEPPYSYGDPLTARERLPIDHNRPNPGCHWHPKYLSDAYSHRSARELHGP